jgi:secreted trypsin-like serine protease
MLKRVLRVLACGAAVTGIAIPAVAYATADPDPTPPIDIQIIHGQPATEPYPFAASLQTLGGGHFCGGALIRPDWVITAGHCVAGETPGGFQVRVGSTDRTSGGTVATVRRIVSHPQDDQALVQLTSAVSHEPLPIAANANAGTAIRLLGWGATSDPGGSAPIILQQFDTSILADNAHGCVTGAAEICTDNPGKGGACYGDSGGPAVARNGSGWAIVGTTIGEAGGQHCADNVQIYSDVPAHRAWLDSVIGGTPPPPPPPPGKVFKNDTDVAIPDLGTAESPITVTGISGNAPANLRASVTIRHTYRGDLVLSLIAPDGTRYLLEDLPNGDSGNDVVKTYTVDASSEVANGTWKLRVQDTARLDVGRIDTWSLTF